jgi:hypothetical protein
VVWERTRSLVGVPGGIGITGPQAPAESVTAKKTALEKSLMPLLRCFNKEASIPLGSLRDEVDAFGSLIKDDDYVASV